MWIVKTLYAVKDDGSEGVRASTRSQFTVGNDGLTTDGHKRLRALEHENRYLRRANEKTNRLLRCRLVITEAFLDVALLLSAPQFCSQLEEFLFSF